ncbi:MAG: hypothetical protein HYV07_04840 [Deltaproteobacteria bacterium]|nr:hypothetical protein [Deltaproteobacteria bacterium]
MGSVFNRGTRAKPNYYIKYRDADGVWRMRRAKGAETKEQARKLLAAAERNVSEGRAGIAPAAAEGLPCGELMEQWAAALGNRNARDDRSRLRNHVKPAFGAKRLEEVTIKSIMEWLDAQRGTI